MAHPYCTAADLLALRIATEEELLQLTDQSGAGFRDDAIIAGAATTASIEIDPYLEPHTQVPLDVIPAAIRRLACVLTRYYLYGQAPTEHVQTQYNAAVRTLTLMSEGKIGFGAPAATTPPPADGMQWDSGARAWGRDTGGGLA